jgi:hypothetical protein
LIITVVAPLVQAAQRRVDCFGMYENFIIEFFLIQIAIAIFAVPAEKTIEVVFLYQY